MKDFKPIKGSQILPPLNPNNLMEECIRVPKVYDWVFDTNSDTNKVPLPGDPTDPESCAGKVRAALEAGNDIRIECSESSSECDVVEVVNGAPGEAGTVRIIWTAFLIVQVFNQTTGELLCEFDVPVQFDDVYAVCIPAPLDESNVRCEITRVICRATNRVLLGNMVELTVIVCKEIQIENEVKLEVLAKFCQPRPNDIPPPTPPEEECPTFEFPPQCPDIFPRQNCDCQAAADSIVQNQTVLFNGDAEIGDVSLTAQICNNCVLSQSSWTFAFTDTNGYLYNDQSFTATPLSFNVTCVDDLAPDTVIMTVTGIATMTFTSTGQSQNVNYTLTLSELPGMNDEYQLILSDSLGNPIFNSNPVVVPDADLIVRDCETFNEL
ncbi:hypothetical protein [Bacillus sp. FJAT-47783]|uniref:hypothetical protein n=1 Tax=Bacillus sp. FJAT-47783 TaxID=2922712 RepID=UPI001FACB8B6|nr:hypothetical protein [Bacillus sp. FJAT-47783]